MPVPGDSGGPGAVSHGLLSLSFAPAGLSGPESVNVLWKQMLSGSVSPSYAVSSEASFSGQASAQEIAGGSSVSLSGLAVMSVLADEPGPLVGPLELNVATCVSAGSSLRRVGSVPSYVRRLDMRSGVGCFEGTAITGILAARYRGEGLDLGERCFFGCSGIGGIAASFAKKIRSAGPMCFAESGLATLANMDRFDPVADGCFRKCTGLGSLVGGFSASAARLGDCLFEGCTGLKSLAGLRALPSLGSRCFAGCSGITDLSGLPAGPVSGSDSDAAPVTFGSRAFWNCSGLQRLEAPDIKVRSFGDECFCECAALSSLAGLPTALETLGTGCFAWCDALEDISALETIAAPSFRIPDRCFIGDRSLRTVPDLAGRHVPVGDSAFYGCTALHGLDWLDFSSLAVHDLVPGDSESFYSGTEESDDVGEYAFAECTGLTGAVGLEFAGEEFCRFPSGMFSGCSGLLSAGWPGNLFSVGEHAFDGCANLTGFVRPDGLDAESESESESDEVAVYDPNSNSFVFDVHDVRPVDAGAFAFRGCKALAGVDEIVADGWEWAVKQAAFLDPGAVIGATLRGIKDAREQVFRYSLDEPYIAHLSRVATLRDLVDYSVAPWLFQVPINVFLTHLLTRPAAVIYTHVPNNMFFQGSPGLLLGLSFMPSWHRFYLEGEISPRVSPELLEHLEMKVFVMSDLGTGGHVASPLPWKLDLECPGPGLGMQIPVGCMTFGPEFLTKLGPPFFGPPEGENPPARPFVTGVTLDGVIDMPTRSPPWPDKDCISYLSNGQPTLKFAVSMRVPDHVDVVDPSSVIYTDKTVHLPLDKRVEFVPPDLVKWGQDARVKVRDFLEGLERLVVGVGKTSRELAPWFLGRSLLFAAGEDGVDGLIASFSPGDENVAVRDACVASSVRRTIHAVLSRSQAGLRRFARESSYEGCRALSFSGREDGKGTYPAQDVPVRGFSGTGVTRLSFFCDAVSLGRFAFAHCQSLTSLSGWPQSVDVVPEGAFLGCSRLRSLHGMPDGLRFRRACFAGTGLFQLDCADDGDQLYMFDPSLGIDYYYSGDDTPSSLASALILADDIASYSGFELVPPPEASIPGASGLVLSGVATSLAYALHGLRVFHGDVAPYMFADTQVTDETFVRWVPPTYPTTASGMATWIGTEVAESDVYVRVDEYVDSSCSVLADQSGDRITLIRAEAGGERWCAWFGGPESGYVLGLPMNSSTNGAVPSSSITLARVNGEWRFSGNDLGIYCVSAFSADPSDLGYDVGAGEYGNLSSFLAGGGRLGAGSQSHGAPFPRIAFGKVFRYAPFGMAAGESFNNRRRMYDPATVRHGSVVDASFARFYALSSWFAVVPGSAGGAPLAAASDQFVILDGFHYVTLEVVPDIELDIETGSGYVKGLKKFRVKFRIAGLQRVWQGPDGSPPLSVDGCPGGSDPDYGCVPVATVYFPSFAPGMFAGCTGLRSLAWVPRHIHSFPSKCFAGTGLTMDDVPTWVDDVASDCFDSDYDHTYGLNYSV